VQNNVRSVISRFKHKPAQTFSSIIPETAPIHALATLFDKKIIYIPKPWLLEAMIKEFTMNI